MLHLNTSFCNNESFACSSPLTCETTNWDSECNLISFTPISYAKLSLTMHVLYPTWLLEVEKLKQRETFTTRPSTLSRMRSTSFPLMFGESYIKINLFVYGSFMDKVISKVKLEIACALSTFLGSNEMPNYEIMMKHFV